MHKKTIRTIAAATLLGFGMTICPVTAMAESSNIVAETADKTTLTVSQIQDLAVIYNPTNQLYELNRKKLELNTMMTSNSLQSAQDNLQSDQYRVDNSALKAIQQELAALTLEAGEEPTAEQAAKIEELTGKMAVAEEQLSAAYAQAEAKLQSALAGIEQTNKTLDSYKEQQEDLNKTREDWKKQVRMIAEVLCVQLNQYDQNIEILKKKITLAEKNLKLAQVQKELGMTLDVNVTETQLSLSNANQSLKTAETAQASVKRQINLLIGRPLEAELEVVQKTAPVVVSDVPAYSGELVAKFIALDKTLKNYDKSIKDYQDSVEGVTASDTLQMADYNIEGVKLNIEDRKRTVANNVRNQLNKMENDRVAYENSQKSYVNAKKNYEVAQVKYELGMITGASMIQQEISYKNAVLNHWKAQYTYYMDWQEYKEQLAGTDLSTYSTYRM